MREVILDLGILDRAGASLQQREFPRINLKARDVMVCGQQDRIRQAHIAHPHDHDVQ